MKVHELYPFEEERRKKKRVGRGSASNFFYAFFSSRLGKPVDKITSIRL